MYINPKYWKYLEPVMAIGFLAVGIYCLNTPNVEYQKLFASLSFGFAVISIGFVVLRAKEYLHTKGQKK